MKEGGFVRKDFQDFVDVINNVIFDKEIDASEINLEKIYLLAKSHNMRTLLFCFIKKHFGSDSNIYKAYEHQSDLLSYKYVLQSKEYAALCSMMQNKKIRYIPFKGTILKELYPSPVMREMSDIDILVDKENMSAVNAYLIKNGYEFEHKGHHDVYRKEPGICFEVHETLIDKQRSTGFDKYFENPWQLSTPSEFKCLLTPENEFIYLIAHLYGHFHQGGIGIRTVLDIYLYRENTNLNFDYINTILEQNEILQFADNVMNLADVWFSGAKTSPIYEELGEYIMTSGTYGKIERMNLDLSSSDSSKMKNILHTVQRKLFLNKKEINTRYPWSKNPLLLPMAYIVRVFDVAINHNKEVHHWVNEFKTMDNTKLKEHKERMQRFGVRI